MNAEQAYWRATLAVQQARGAVYPDTAALFQALGGGWWTREGGASRANTDPVVRRNDGRAQTGD